MMKKQIIQQVHTLISKDSSVIDIGCGKGDLLFCLSPKIRYGLGIDVNSKKIDFAKRRKYGNLEFKVKDSSQLDLNHHFDYSVAMFAIHAMDYSTQIKTLKNLSELSDKIIIVDIVPSDSFFKQSLISIDEILAGHYSKFKKYSKTGMNTLIKKFNLNVIEQIKGIYNFYNIWICN